MLLKKITRISEVQPKRIKSTPESMRRILKLFRYICRKSDCRKIEPLVVDVIDGNNKEGRQLRQHAGWLSIS